MIKIASIQMPNSISVRENFSYIMDRLKELEVDKPNLVFFLNALSLVFRLSLFLAIENF